MGDWGWDGRGNRMLNNYIHHSEARVIPGGSFNAIYLDGSCAGDIIRGNVFYHAADMGIMHNSGREVVIEHNIIVGSKAAIHPTNGRWYRDEPGHAMNFLDRIRQFDYQTPPWSTGYPQLAQTPNDRDDPGFARYLSPVGSRLIGNIGWANHFWIDPRKHDALDYYAVVEGNLEDEDPLFIDEAGTNLGLRSESPVHDISGFERIPFEQIGLLAADRATRPFPPDGYAEFDVSGPHATLHWAPAFGALSRDIYFSTNEVKVRQGAKSVRRQRLHSATDDFAANDLIPATTYHWRVDERGAAAARLGQGEVWSFTTRPADAFGPRPLDGAINSHTNASLSWRPGWADASHEVYIGTDPQLGEAEFRGRQLAASYNAPLLIGGQAYYWRIDEIDADGDRTVGPVWSFTIGTDGALTLYPKDRIEFNTTEATGRINGGPAFEGTLEEGVASFAFGDLDIRAGAVLTASGEPALKLSSSGDIMVRAIIDISGLDATDQLLHEQGRRGGPGQLGGFSGGDTVATDKVGVHGSGPGGGRAATSIHFAGGGAGGGALKIEAVGDITIEGALRARGGNGSGFRRTDGGGSGGSLMLQAGGTLYSGP